MIYGRFGESIVLKREATLEEVLKDWGVKPTAKSREAQKDRLAAEQRTGYGMLWWASYPDGETRMVELAYCRADDGWREIDRIRERLMTPERYAECVGRPIPAKPAIPE